MNVSFQGIQIKTYNPLRAPCFRRLVLSLFYDPFSLYPTGHKLTRTRTDGTDGCRPTDRWLCCVGAGRRHLPLGAQHPEPQHPRPSPEPPRCGGRGGDPPGRRAKGSAIFTFIWQDYSQIDPIRPRRCQGSRGPLRESMLGTSFLFIMRTSAFSLGFWQRNNQWKKKAFTFLTFGLMYFWKHKCF